MDTAVLDEHFGAEDVAPPVPLSCGILVIEAGTAFDLQADGGALGLVGLLVAARLYLAVDHPSDVAAALVTGAALPTAALRLRSSSIPFQAGSLVGTGGVIYVYGPPLPPGRDFRPEAPGSCGGCLPCGGKKGRRSRPDRAQQPCRQRDEWRMLNMSSEPQTKGGGRPVGNQRRWETRRSSDRDHRLRNCESKEVMR